jgi:biopolymer transport protein ExbB/TolQ
MKKSAPPKFTPFNQRDIKTALSILSPLIFVLLLSLKMHKFVVEAVEANLAINLGIIGAAAFGVFLILRRLFAAQHDFRIVERFGYEASQGAFMQDLLEQPWVRNRYVRHYLSRIAHTGGTLSSHMEQSAIENELHALQQDYESRLELPQFLVGFMIAMGLLGTFIGLLETLTGISGMLDGMGQGGEDVEKQFMKLVVELRKPLAGMGIAFSASMFGLITSLMLSVMMTNLRRYVSRVISLARNVMFELTEMVHEHHSSLSPTDVSILLSSNPQTPAAIAAPAAPAGVPSVPLPPAAELPAPVPEASGQGNREHQRFGGIDPAMSGRFDVLTKKIEILLTAFQANTESTRKLTDLIGFGPRMKELSEKTLDEIRSIASTSTDQHMLLQNLVSGNSELIRTLAMFVDSQKLASAEGNDQMRKVSSMLIDVKDAAIGNGRHLNEIKEHFSKLGFNKNVEMVEMIATNLSGQTALLEALLQETRSTHKSLAEALGASSRV